MPIIKRRHFLQSIGASLTILGVNQFAIHQASLNYGQVLAQDTRRKRALLVGINNYPGKNAQDLKTQGLWYQLRGAVNDVELQRELLIHRFGFHPDDILVLTDQEATRQNILENFKKHLIEWVKSPDDVVVFHYSGHGSNVIDPYKIFPEDRLNGTIVPVDADLPLGYPNKGGEVNDITAGTIFLLREALGRKTKNVTFILDSCYSGAGVRGNLIIRSRPGYAELLKLRGDTPNIKLKSIQEELDYQQHWLTDLKLSKEEWIERRKKNIVNGAAIFAAGRNQQAADASFAKDVNAGVFTYSLTRQLWQQTSNQGMGKVVIAAAGKTEQFLQSMANSRPQNPGLEVKIGSSDEQQPMYFSSMQKLAAEAVITEVKGNDVKLLLTGAEPQVLEALGKGAIFNIVDNHGQRQGTVKIESRSSLNATGLLQTKSGVKISPGAVLQEQIRAIPADFQLGQYPKAIEFHQQSLAIKREIGDRNGEATSLNNLGGAYFQLGQYPKAIEFYQQSLAIKREIGDRHGEGVSLGNLGNAYKSLGQYPKAIEFHQQSLAISREIGDRKGEGLSLNNLGLAYDSLGQYPKAIEFFQQSLAISREIGDRNGEGTSLSNIGLTREKQQQPELAIVFYKQSVNIIENIRQDSGSSSY
jgi:tetratricopeptide (TPR) repeat protein